MIKDILLPLPSYPKTASPKGLRKAVDLARLLEAHLTGLVVETAVPMPVAFHPYSTELETQLKTRQNEVHSVAQSQLEAFEAEAERAGISRQGIIVKVAEGNTHPAIDYARLRDLTVVPFIDGSQSCTDLVQALVFESGRPVMVMPEGKQETFSLDRIVVAWDASRASVRAVGDAMPLLRLAKDVRVVTVNKDKVLPENATGTELAAHLARNGVKVTLQDLDRGNETVGKTLDKVAADADLLVMGAFGHSRIRDFFLGSATAHVLKNPLRPTLLSH
ncbi:MAG: universal stress protein [Aquamicrobium sp.]|nr:universal stress protein [Aquamicrobium sp.]